MIQMKVALLRLSLGIFLLFHSYIVLASQSVAPSPIASPVSWIGMVQVLFGLGFVLFAIVGSAWLLRRFSPGQVGAGGAIKVIGGVALGPKERLVLVEIGDVWLVLGVAPGQVNSLHTLPKPEGGVVPSDASLSDTHPFSKWLKQAMQGRTIAK